MRSFVYGVWNIAEGDVLIALFALFAKREDAEALSYEMNTSYRNVVRRHGLTPDPDWPTQVRQHELF